jgi:hypothetical protein
MSALPDQSETISRYLLNDLPPDQRDALEQRYFADPELLALVEAVEGELIEAYVQRELSPADRARFERYFLRSRARRERVENAEALQGWMPRAAARPPRAMWLAIAAMLLIVAGSLVWLWMENRKLRSDVDRLREESARTVVPAKPRAIPPVMVPPPQQAERVPAPEAHGVPLVVSVIITPGLTRDTASLQRIVLPRGTGTLRLHAAIDMESDAGRYAATLRTSDGHETWTGQGLHLQRDGAARLVIASIPAARLTAGEYVLTVSADGEPVGDYPLRIVRR